MYFETDPALSEAMILAFGRKLRETFYTHLPQFASSLRLLDQEDLYPLHADFLSRLAMTFSHGDYAQIEAIPDKPAVAEALYSRSLDYAPNHRAYLGLGMIKQQQRHFAASADVLSEGAARCPESEEMHLCLGISLMNLGRWDEALKAFSRFPHSKRMAPYAQECRKALSKP